MENAKQVPPEVVNAPKVDEVKVMTLEEIKALAKRPVQELLLPDFKRKVYWRKLNGKEQAAAESYIEFDDDGKATEESMRQWPALLTAASLCDQAGNRLYGDQELDSLADAPSEFIQPIYKAVSQLTSTEALKN